MSSMPGIGPRFAQLTPPVEQPGEEPPAQDTPVADDAPLSPWQDWLGGRVRHSLGPAVTDGVVWGSVPMAAAGGQELIRWNSLERPGFESAIKATSKAALKVTPAMVFSVAGPAVADGVSLLFPTVVKPYKADMNKETKDFVRFQRGASAAVVTGAGAFFAFSKWPKIFKSAAFLQDGVGVGNFMKASAISAEPLRMNQMLKVGTGSLARTVGIAGVLAGAGLATYGLISSGANKDRSLNFGATGAVVAGGALAAATGLSLLTRGGRGAINGVAFLPESLNAIKIPKPSPELVKKVKDFANVAAPVSVVPATTAAVNHFDVRDAFGKVLEGDKKPPAKPASNKK